MLIINESGFKILCFVLLLFHFFLNTNDSQHYAEHKEREYEPKQNNQADSANKG